MFCKECGKKINENSNFCGNCGTESLVQSDENGAIGWGVLSFFIPVAGLILYLIWKNEKPKSAKYAGIGGIIGFVGGIVMSILFYVFLFGFFAMTGI